MTEEYFSEVGLYMGNKTERRTQDETVRIRESISHHKNEYLQISGYEWPVFPYSRQCSFYEGIKIYTTYMNKKALYDMPHGSSWPLPGEVL
ncbi:hypothetical protein BX666DRAFT_1969474 [Dichotomocladium elegans]|nr:hypothetical protein BX666DRAFT_1969474 [Dichotomocladium elegans]